MAPETGRSPIPDPELRRLARKGLEVKLPDDLARQVLGRVRRSGVPATRLWQTAAAAAACFVLAAILLVMSLPETADVPPPDGGLVVTLRPEPGPAPSRLQYTVSAGGAIADQGHLELTRYAMDTVSVDALTPVTY